MRKRLRELLRETRGLQFRSTLLMMIVVAVATGLSGALFLRISARLVIEEAKIHARQVAQSLAIAGAKAVLEGDRIATLDIAQRLMGEDEFIYVAFADRTGKVLGGAQRGPGELKRWLTSDGESLRIGQIDHPALEHTDAHSATVDLVFPVRDASIEAQSVSPPPIAGYVRIGISLSRTEERLIAVARQVSGVSIGIALLMVPLGYEVVRRLVLPLDAVATAARDLAAGQLDRRVEVRRSDEIGRLGEAFNAMAVDLSRSHNALIKLNAELEDRVLHRTEQLAESNRLLTLEIAEREELIRVVSHDLHAPLRNISGQAMLLRRRLGEKTAPELEHCLSRIEYNVRYETAMIDELLELTRLRACYEQPQSIDVGDELRAIARQLEFEMERKRISFQIDEPLPTVVAPRHRLRHVLQNLIDNAVKYSDPETRDSLSIVVSVRERPGGYEFRIADRGIGVQAQDRDRVFKVFSRGGGPIVNSTPGKGVGLAHCRSVVRTWGGKIWIEGNPGGGSVFCFTLDRARIAAGGPGEGPPRQRRHRKPEGKQNA